MSCLPDRNLLTASTILRNLPCLESVMISSDLLINLVEKSYWFFLTWQRRSIQSTMPCFSNAYVSAMVLAAKYFSGLSLTFTNANNLFLSTLLNLTRLQWSGHSSRIHRRTDSVRQLYGSSGGHYSRSWLIVCHICWWHTIIYFYEVITKICYNWENWTMHIWHQSLDDQKLSCSQR